MADWQSIDTAPKNGTPITVKRVYQGRVVYEGPAVWRAVTFPALPPDPLGRPELVETGPYTATGWMRVDREKRVPTPTHWKPTE